MSTAQQQGYEAHANHKMRVENPYMHQAAEWDRGWAKRQREELRKSGLNKEAEAVMGFVRFVKEHV